MHKFVSVCVAQMLASSNGRLYRCDVTPALSNGALRSDDPASDDDWEEQEASRTLSVKFSDPQDQDNREVRCYFQNCCFWVWLVKCFNHNLRQSESYYMLHHLPEVDD